MLGELYPTLLQEYQHQLQEQLKSGQFFAIFMFILRPSSIIEFYLISLCAKLDKT